jgi:CheY-like chemotaxis protein
MLDSEDLKWIASASTSLNSILQQIARYKDLARRHKNEHHYLDLLGERVDLGAKTAQAIFERVTSKILSKTNMQVGLHPAFSIVPPPVPTVSPRTTSAPSPTFDSPSQKATAVATRPVPTLASNPGETLIPSEIKVRNPKGNREYILIVEDDFDIAELAVEMLSEEGYKPIVAHDGFEALQIYQRIGKHIGLVILDFFLPVMDGDAVFDELRGLNPNINVVLSSGFAEQDKVSAMLAQGLRGFIPKPYSPDKLLAQVRSTLDSARQGLR